MFWWPLGVAAAVGFLGAWLITFTAPYFINPSALNWGPKYGYIWFPCCFIAALWVYFFIPETKGRTLEEIDAMVCSFEGDRSCASPICKADSPSFQFKEKLPARKFRTYQITPEEPSDKERKASVEVVVQQAEKV